MTFTHTPRVRIPWSYIGSNAVNPHVVMYDTPAIMFVGLHVDPTVRLRGGIFQLNFDIFRDGQLINRSSIGGWMPTELPTWTDFWMSKSYNSGTDLTGNRYDGVFLFRPSFTLKLWGPGGISSGDSEFAIADEDYYFMIN